MVQFRKSKKVGPFRITATKRGLSASAGTSWFRVSRNSKGQSRATTTLPGTGIYSTRRLDKSRERSGTADQRSTMVSVDALDVTGDTRRLFEHDSDVATLQVVGMREARVGHDSLAAWLGVKANADGWTRGIRTRAAHARR